MQTILVIDDEEALPETLADRLTLEGFSVRTAPDGAEGIRRALDFSLRPSA